MQSTAESSATTASPFLVRSVSIPSGEAPTVPSVPIVNEAGTPATEATEAVPIDIYEEHRGRPYIADLLDLSSDYGKSGLEGELKDIDSYVLAKIAEDQLKPSKESYQSVLRTIESDLGLDPNLRSDIRARKVADYIRIITEQTKLEQERRKLTNLE